MFKPQRLNKNKMILDKNLKSQNLNKKLRPNLRSQNPNKKLRPNPKLKLRLMLRKRKHRRRTQRHQLRRKLRQHLQLLLGHLSKSYRVCHQVNMSLRLFQGKMGSIICFFLTLINYFQIFRKTFRILLRYIVLVNHPRVET